MLRQTFDSLFRKRTKRRASKDRSWYLKKLDGIEELLPRILLSAEPFYTAELESTGFDLQLKVISDTTGDRLALLQNATGEIVASADLVDIEDSIRIVGSAYDDLLHVELGHQLVASALPHGVLFEAGGGDDRLQGPAENTMWNVTGNNIGNIADEGVFSFYDVENLFGNVDNEDTFVILEDASLTGLVSGGAGGFDSLVVDGGTFASVVYTATGPDSGTIIRDGETLTYAGLEPIVDNSSSTDLVIGASDFTDHARLVDLGGQLRFESTDAIPTFESITFIEPTNSLTLNLGDDSSFPLVPLNDTLDVQALVLDADLIVNGADGTDEITISGDMNLAGNPLTVNSEQITVNAGVTVTAGDITFHAAAMLGTAVTPDVLPVATVEAAVNINGANLIGDNILLSATTTYHSSLTNPTLLKFARPQGAR